MLPSVAGSCNSEMGLQKRGALGEKMGVRLRVEEHEREQGEWGLWLEKARGSSSCWRKNKKRETVAEERDGSHGEDERHGCSNRAVMVES